jgi:hypothetical protein
MNLRRGAFRTWAVISVAWVVIVCGDHSDAVREIGAPFVFRYHGMEYSLPNTTPRELVEKELIAAWFASAPKADLTSGSPLLATDLHGTGPAWDLSDDKAATPTGSFDSSAPKPSGGKLIYHDDLPSAAVTAKQLPPDMPGSRAEPARMPNKPFTVDDGDKSSGFDPNKPFTVVDASETDEGDGSYAEWAGRKAASIARGLEPVAAGAAAGGAAEKHFDPSSARMVVNDPSKRAAIVSGAMSEYEPRSLMRALLLIGGIAGSLPVALMLISLTVAWVVRGFRDS